ncbi:hypothetical protein SUGI_0545470 [Cryptomeria japonica]|nr:hypothetical protein SUGI_0545470 [Cryptomeria japonica]
MGGQQNSDDPQKKNVDGSLARCRPLFQNGGSVQTFSEIGDGEKAKGRHPITVGPSEGGTLFSSEKALRGKKGSLV